MKNLSLSFSMTTTTPSVSMTENSVSSLGSKSTTNEMPHIICCNRATPFNDKTLHPTTGKLRIRLDTSQPHWPLENQKSEANCQLHKWVTGKKKKGSLVRCSVCNVTLCVKCFVQFHTISDLQHSKAFLKIELGGCVEATGNTKTGGSKTGDTNTGDGDKSENCGKRKRNEGGVYIKCEEV